MNIREVPYALPFEILINIAALCNDTVKIILNKVLPKNNKIGSCRKNN